MQMSISIGTVQNDPCTTDKLVLFIGLFLQQRQTLATVVISILLSQIPNEWLCIYCIAGKSLGGKISRLRYALCYFVNICRGCVVVPIR